MANFDDYLKVKVEDIQAPEAPIEGHYFANVKSWRGIERNYGEGKEKTPVLEVTFQITGPDTDADEAAQAAGIDVNKFTNRMVSRDYTLSEEGGQFGLRQLGETACGIDTKGLELGDMLDACKGGDVKLYMTQRAGKGDREGQFFPNVSKVLPAQD